MGIGGSGKVLRGELGMEVWRRGARVVFARE